MMHFCIFTSMRQLLIFIEACHFHLLSSRNSIFNKCHSNNAFKLRHFMGSQLCIFLPILELRFKYAKDFLLIFWTILQIWRKLFSIETNRLVDTIWDYNVIHWTCVIFSSHNVIEAQHITLQIVSNLETSGYFLTASHCKHVLSFPSNRPLL